MEKPDQPSNLSAWLLAMRPRTLPLALASIGMGVFLALADGVFEGRVAALCVSTALFLQILSNLANDYGDYVHGADKTGRQGPLRAVESGLIAPRAMKVAIAIFALLSMLSGLALIWLALGAEAATWLIIFAVIGALAIGAAIAYTAGGIAFGYTGLGDLAVFVFFGLVAVLGTYFLQAQGLDWTLLLPATSAGLLAVAVLNVNNIRDLESDAKAGKRSIPVRLGRQRARIYHWALLLFTLAAAIVYVIITFRSWWQFLFLLSVPLFWCNGTAVARAESPVEVSPMLKQTVLLALLFVILFGVGQLISR
jgi:1,4-dihydroxy-2-naphthoate polyprenyltransferase